MIETLFLFLMIVLAVFVIVGAITIILFVLTRINDE